jgi:hypothetical protein
LAWGRQGHLIVAEIAEQYLEASIARQVRDLLALENVTTLADVSIWADQVRLQRPETSPWHYVNIPAQVLPGQAPAYAFARDCVRGNCVVAKINDFVRVLGDSNASSAPERLEALKFIVHFVADIHQPLHCIKEDRGGNEIRILSSGKLTNLHAIWDSSILALAIQYGSERDYALRLARSLTISETAVWRNGLPEEWANESYKIATDVIYKKLPDNAGNLPSSYEREMLPIVNQQLRRAGVRLAKSLNEALAITQIRN